MPQPANPRRLPTAPKAECTCGRTRSAGPAYDTRAKCSSVEIQIPPHSGFGYQVNLPCVMGVGFGCPTDHFEPDNLDRHQCSDPDKECPMVDTARTNWWRTAACA